MSVRVDDITTKTWSVKVASLGDIVADIEDIKQCVALIVFTRKRSVPGEPEFGCDWYNYIDYPINTAGAFMVREIRNSVSRWETRAAISDLQHKIVNGNLQIGITMQPAFNRPTDPLSSIFFGFELEYNSGTIYLIDQFGYRITVNGGLQLTIQI